MVMLARLAAALQSARGLANSSREKLQYANQKKFVTDVVVVVVVLFVPLFSRFCGALSD